MGNTFYLFVSYNGHGDLQKHKFYSSKKGVKYIGFMNSTGAIWSRYQRVIIFLFLLWFNVPVNNFSVMLRRSHLFLGITSTFLGSKCLLLKETNTPPRPRIEPGSPDPESDALTIRPVRPPQRVIITCISLQEVIKRPLKANIP